MTQVVGMVTACSLLVVKASQMIIFPSCEMREIIEIIIIVLCETAGNDFSGICERARRVVDFVGWKGEEK